MSNVCALPYIYIVRLHCVFSRLKIIHVSFVEDARNFITSLANGNTKNILVLLITCINDRQIEIDNIKRKSQETLSLYVSFRKTQKALRIVACYDFLFEKIFFMEEKKMHVLRFNCILGNATRDNKKKLKRHK